MKQKIREMPEELRPVEKCRVYGPEALSDAELLAVLLRTGIPGTNVKELAEQILLHAGGLFGLHGFSLREWERIPGIGPVKATQIVCLCALVQRFHRSGRGFRPSFNSPKDVADYYMDELRPLEQEVLRVLFLDGKSRLIREKEMAKGAVNFSIMPIREILIEALKCEAVTLILVHNHPSGDPTPSKEDVEGTRNICYTGRLAGIEVEDHIIIGDRRFISLRERGLMQ